MLNIWFAAKAVNSNQTSFSIADPAEHDGLGSTDFVAPKREPSTVSKQSKPEFTGIEIAPVQLSFDPILVPKLAAVDQSLKVVSEHFART